MSTGLPTVGLKGAFTFKDPLTHISVTAPVLECVAVRSFGDIISSGRDPYEHFYHPLDLSKETYNHHARKGSYIVTLVSEANEYFYVPSPYLASFPIPGGYAYEVVALVCSLGPILKDMDLTPILTQAKELVQDNLGIRPEVKLVKISETKYLSTDDASSLEAGRDNLKKSNKGIYAEMRELRQRIEELEQENQAMREYIEEQI